MNCHLVLSYLLYQNKYEMGYLLIFVTNEFIFTHHILSFYPSFGFNCFHYRELATSSTSPKAPTKDYSIKKGQGLADQNHATKKGRNQLELDSMNLLPGILMLLILKIGRA